MSQALLLLLFILLLAWPAACRAATLPGCVANQDCVISGEVVYSSSVTLTHTGNLTVDSGGSIVCLTDFCRLELQVEGDLVVRGVVRAPLIYTTATDTFVVGGQLDSSHLGGLPGQGAGGGKSAKSASGGGGGCTCNPTQCTPLKLTISHTHTHQMEERAWRVVPRPTLQVAPSMAPLRQ